MREFIKNWNYVKHASLVTGLYAFIFTVGNLIIGTNKTLKKTEGKKLSKRIGKLSKKEKLFNIGVASCYVLDMTLAFGIIKIVQRKS